MSQETRSVALDALTLIAALYEAREDDANAMLGTYRDPAERDLLFSATLAHVVCILRLFGSVSGQDPAKMLAVVGMEVRAPR
jgi:hypothetical protein